MASRNERESWLGSGVLKVLEDEGGDVNAYGWKSPNRWKESGFESAQRDRFVLEVRSLEYSEYDSLTISLLTPSTL